MSPYEVGAGTIIPAVMLTTMNSDSAGQVIGQVRENVYDSDTSDHLLIPQGTVVGLYDHHIVDGQQRVLITWKRLIPARWLEPQPGGDGRHRRGRRCRLPRIR